MQAGKQNAQSRMANGPLGKGPAPALPVINYQTFKLPQRPSEAGRKRHTGAPLRRVLGSKRVHYFTASTPTRSPAAHLTPGAHTPQTGSSSSSKGTPLVPAHVAARNEGLTARNLSLDLGGLESPVIFGNKSDLITPSPMSIATPRAPHKYFNNLDQAASKHEDGGKDADARALTMHEDTPSSPLAVLVLPQPLCQSRSKLSNMPERVLQTRSNVEAEENSVDAVALLSPLMLKRRAIKAAEAPSSQAKTPRAPKRSLFDLQGCNSSTSP